MRPRPSARRSAPLRACLAWLAVTASATGACNALIDNHDRQLDERANLGDGGGKDAAKDTTGGDDTGGGGADVNVPDDTGVTPVTIPVANSWKTPNGAKFVTTDAGTTITGYGTAGHAVIFPMTPPSIPSDDYTVIATVRAPTNGEFGIIARVQANDSVALLGSKFGVDNKPFIGTMAAPDWSPNLLTLGQLYSFTPGARYKLVLRVVGDQAAGKMWNVLDPEPPSFQILGLLPWKTGRGVGYYIYNTYDTVLESMQVTVP